MAFTTPRTWTYGETVTEAQFNEQLRDNFNALWVGQAAGDVDYYTSNTTKARLVGGTANAGKFIRLGTGGTAIEYASAGGIVSRQGGDAVDWNVAGTTNYTPDNSVIQSGCATIVAAAGDTYGSVTITYPIAFIGKPNVNFTLSDPSYNGSITAFYTSGEGLSSVYLYIVFSVAQSFTRNIKAHWEARGEIA